MIDMADKKTLLKLAVKVVFFAGLAGFFLYKLVTLPVPDQSTVIDKSITYTTNVYTSTVTSNITPSVEEVVESIPKYVTIPEGGLDWKVFAKTKSIPYSYTDEEGRELNGVKPEFPDQLQKLDGQEIILQGYMFPLNAAEDQSMFLFGPFPVSCPYHYHVGPALVIEAYSLKKIEFGFEPLTLKGKLELVPRDDDYNVFYRLREARLIQ